MEDFEIDDALVLLRKLQKTYKSKQSININSRSDNFNT